MSPLITPKRLGGFGAVETASCRQYRDWRPATLHAVRGANVGSRLEHSAIEF